MLRTLARRAQYGLESGGARGIHPWSPREHGYKSFKSRYGPDYKIGPHLFGLNASNGLTAYDSLLRILPQPQIYLAGGFGAVAGIFALFFFDGVPRVKTDILQKLPFVGGFYKNEVPPEDNPF
ncbi:hypothetical protein LTR85_008054 [Meristemomyces frigidus]|nr:hypothetical protein LTR85_008054 [Meristemomyces frigidus]